MGASRSDIIAFLTGDYSVTKKILAEAGNEQAAVIEIIAVQRSLTPEEQELLPEYVKQVFDYANTNPKPSPLSGVPVEAL